MGVSIEFPYSLRSPHSAFRFRCSSRTGAKKNVPNPERLPYHACHALPVATLASEKMIDGAKELPSSREHFRLIAG